MRRREFIGLLAGTAATWPLTLQAQQRAMPVIGFLDARSPNALEDRLRGFRIGLKEAGYVEGENVVIAYRWAENRLERLPELAAELIRQDVAAIVASGGPAVVLAAKQAATAIPVVFILGEDPVSLGFVNSLSRPGGNVTGISFVNRELESKQLELLRELVPTISRLAVLINPANQGIAESTLRDVGLASRAMGFRVQPVRASTSGEIDTAFATLVHERCDSLFVTSDPFFNAHRAQLVLLAARHGIPAIYSGREYAQVGGLMTYGSDITDAYREVGAYAGRILKGAKPANLPVVQASKFELIINVPTARKLGLTVPPTLLSRADEVIE